MALQSEVSPPMVGDANKDTKIDGDTKSDDNDTSQSTDDEKDLEEGEILDSGEEAEAEKDFTNSSLKDSLDKNCLLSIEQLLSQSKNSENNNPSVPKILSPRKLNKRAAKYTDHDQMEHNSDQDDGWFPPSAKFKSKFDDKPIDYRMELAAYRGTPPSSPERKRRDDKQRKKRSSKKSKKPGRKTIQRRDIKGLRVTKYRKEAGRLKSCKFFKEGKCAKGADCGFSHASPKPFKKKELCKFYLNGHCNKGKDCLYMHNEFPCKFYHTGSECYAKDDCRFSHAPLTDEMKNVLADYLKMHHGDDDYERKRRVSCSPEPPKGPPPKRPCLLGSPPRHIREAEETKRWQEEMKMLQHQNLPGFEIRLSPGKEGQSPPQFPKPNFYQETLPNTPSPKKRRIIPEASNPLVLPAGFPPAPTFSQTNVTGMFNRGSPSRGFNYDEEYDEMNIPCIKQEPKDDFDWKNVHSSNIPSTKEDSLKQFVEPAQQELDFTSDVKFDETTQFSEMESSTDCPPVLSPGPNLNKENKESEDDDASNQDICKTMEDKSADESTTSSVEPLAPSIIIPSHLPRKQRELFMRIQQHQRKTAVAASASDVSNSPKDNAEITVKKEEPEEEEEKIEIEKESKWYSSEDDDDDPDQPLTDVLKKLRQAPPPETPKPEVKPTMNLMDMINKIQRNTLERNKNEANSQKPRGAFWENFLGCVSSEKVPLPVSVAATTEPKRRTLLPNPAPLPAAKKDPIQLPKDPRLKNRDPRTLASTTNTAANLPKTITIERSNLQVPPLRDSSIVFPKISAPTTSEPAKESTWVYKLHGIHTKPPNYTPYIHASQSNPQLLNDPRLRKHMNINQGSESSIQNGKEHDTNKTVPPKDVPPIPKLLLKYEKPESLAINIFETSTKPVVEDSQPPAPVVARKLTDPRMRRRESRSNSGSDTPPHLTIIETCSTPPHQEFKTAPILENALTEQVDEKKWLPPVLEKSWTPPVLEKNWVVSVKKEVDSDTENNYDPPHLEISEQPLEKCSSVESEVVKVKTEPPSLETNVRSPPVVPTLIIKKVKPTPASHLPRAIADPRMAKLHHPLETRRSRIAGPELSNKSIVERKKPLQVESSKTVEDSAANELKCLDSSDASKLSTDSSTSKVETEEKSQTVKSIPKKRRLSDRSEEKKKTVHRNRKSSMDYASPLNSCDDTNSTSSLSYNSYNQRPKKQTAKPANATDTSPTSNPALPAEGAEPSIISDYLLSDSSNLECDNSNDVNLKDRFKTIDPTASPFC